MVSTATGPRSWFAGDGREVRISKGCFALSVFATAVFVLLVNGTIRMPGYLLLVPILAYPLYRLAGLGPGSARLDTAYVALSFLGLAGMFAYGSMSPAGYGDVSSHVQHTLDVVQLGRLQLFPNPSGNFPAIYLLTQALLWLTALDVAAVTQFLPVITFTLSLVTFHWFLARKLFPTDQALFTTLLFAFNWGVFRFNIEFRTLDLAFFLMVLLFAVFVGTVVAEDTRTRTTVLSLTLLTTLALAHISTFVFFLILLGVFAASVWYFRDDPRYGYYFVYAVTVLIAYLLWFSDTTAYTLGVVVGTVVSALLLSGASAGGTGGFGGLPYGPVVYWLQWFVRGAFVVSFALFTLSRGRRWFHAFVFVSAISLGVATAIGLVADFALTAVRIFTFFAFPYSLAFGIGVYALRNPQFNWSLGGRRLEELFRRKRVADAARVLVALLLVAALMTTVMKFPTYIVGPTEPVREENPEVDQFTYYEFTERELATRAFLRRWTDPGVTLQFISTSTGNLRGFYALADIEATYLKPDSPESAEAVGPRLVTMKLDCARPSDARYEPVPICTAYADRVYSNGRNYAYQVPSSSWKSEEGTAGDA